VKTEPLSPESPESPSYSQDEDSPSPDVRCYNCCHLLSEERVTDDSFTTWTFRNTVMGWFPVSKDFCSVECHTSALMWTLQAVMPGSSVVHLKSAIHGLIPDHQSSTTVP
jgi:hypothetical protein